MVLFDTVGNVSMVNCSFEDNRVRPREWLVYPGGGGLHMSSDASLLDVTSVSYINSSTSFQGMGEGGGIALYIINGQYK